MRPSPSCTPSQSGGQSDRPPRPGIEARRLDSRRVRVAVTFESVPARCAPDRVRFTLDVDDDRLAPASLVYGYNRVTRPFILWLPRRVANADVISASSIRTRSGTLSDSVPVQITQ